MREGDEIFRVTVLGPKCAFITLNDLSAAVGMLLFPSALVGVECMSMRESRAFPPIRTGSRVLIAVCVKVTKGCSFTPEPVRQL